MFVPAESARITRELYQLLRPPRRFVSSLGEQLPEKVKPKAQFDPCAHARPTSIDLAPSGRHASFAVAAPVHAVANAGPLEILPIRHPPVARSPYSSRSSPWRRSSSLVEIGFRCGQAAHDAAHCPCPRGPSSRNPRRCPSSAASQDRGSGPMLRRLDDRRVPIVRWRSSPQPHRVARESPRRSPSSVRAPPAGDVKRTIVLSSGVASSLSSMHAKRRIDSRQPSNVVCSLIVPSSEGGPGRASSNLCHSHRPAWQSTTLDPLVPWFHRLATLACGA